MKLLTLYLLTWVKLTPAFSVNASLMRKLSVTMKMLTGISVISKTFVHDQPTLTPVGVTERDFTGTCSAHQICTVFVVMVTVVEGFTRTDPVITNQLFLCITCHMTTSDVISGTCFGGGNTGARMIPWVTNRR